MAITKMGMLVVVVGLLAMVQQSVQMSSSSMFMETGNDMSYMAVVFNGNTSESVLLESHDFEQKSCDIIAGRVFRTGTLIGRPVVLVNTGKYSANVASALQIALLKYRIRGVLYFGTAGSLTAHIPVPPLRPISLGDVVIPSKVSFSGIWDWLNLNEDKEAELVFEKFNVGGNVQNALAGIKYKNVALYTGKNDVSYPPHLETDEDWIKKAEEIVKELQNITILVGRKASSADIKVKNRAYAIFLRWRFGFSIVDENSGPVALVSKSNGMRYLTFLGVSNSARDAGIDPKMKLTATQNAYMVLKTFLKSLPEPRGYIATYV